MTLREETLRLANDAANFQQKLERESGALTAQEGAAILSLVNGLAAIVAMLTPIEH